jgi:DNA-binding IclR family transcriptional regulator
MGNRLPAHIVAGGKVMLAFSPPDFVDSVVKEGLIRLTPNTVTEPKILKQKLAKYRQMGLAYDLGESDLDYHFVAAPVFNFAKKPVAAVVTGDLAEKVRKGFNPKILSALKETAAKISARLMYSGEENTMTSGEGD